MATELQKATEPTGLIGSTKMVLNHPTMVRIVQQWMDREFKNPPQVDSVIATNGTMFAVYTKSAS